MLKSSDTLTGAVTKLATGKVRAACVLGRIMDDPFTGRIIVLDLEGIGLRGEQIWMLCWDMHGLDLERFIQHVNA